LIYNFICFIIIVINLGEIQLQLYTSQLREQEMHLFDIYNISLILLYKNQIFHGLRNNVKT